MTQSPRFGRRGQRPGFTLIELLIVVVIIGILASIGLVKYQSARETAWLTMLKSDMEHLAKHQEIYNLRHMEYATLDDLTDFVPSQKVEVTINYSGADGWAGEAVHPNLTSHKVEAVHPNLTSSCGFLTGNAPVDSAGPASGQDVLTCD